MNLQPLRNLVLVKIDRKKLPETESGIILSTTKSVADRETEGTIVAVGPESTLKIGQKVVFEVHAGIDIDDEHTMLRYESILGILNK